LAGSLVPTDKRFSRDRGARRAADWDFHSFRVTWITLAPAAGVPLELVQRVTGHKTVEIVLKHYLRPGREDFKQRILAAMPTLLSGSPRQSGGRDDRGEDFEATETGKYEEKARLSAWMRPWRL